MAAFEKVCSGIPEMDLALDHIRLGDNVVWRLSRLEDFQLFMKPYVQQALADKRNLIYIRFASHEPLLAPQEGLRIIQVPLSHRFETFTVQIHNIIAREGLDAFYVFDCLSELMTAWATDLMMGNFFQVTCPFLFQLDTVAFFPIIRGKHSAFAEGRIQETTQLFFDVYTGQGSRVFVRPVKVWNRSSETMFLPHLYKPETGSFRPVLNGVESSRFYQLLYQAKGLADQKTTDSWDRFFDRSARDYEEGRDIQDECSQMCDIMMTRDDKLRQMVKDNFRPEDYFQIRERMIGTGMVGGKACGMLLARKIIENRDPDLFSRLEPHDSFYMGSDVFYTYIVENHFWDMRIRQRTQEEYFALADDFADKLLHGSFSPALEERFRLVLEYYGRDPYIVRSSSILEDGFGNAFAGKYESVFCSNNGTLEERLLEFEAAIRFVYASTMSLSALTYRQQRGLAKRDEQMALLIQRVSGSHYGDYYFPCAAGVGYSYSPYRFLPDLDAKAGMLRLVMGLGTAAVDRAEGSYPRLVNLDRPRAIAAKNVAEKHRFSQRNIDVVHKSARKTLHLELDSLMPLLPPFLKKALLEHDTEAERRFMDMGQYRDISFISCEGLVKREDLMGDMQRLLLLIQEAYDYPVDVEFTINLSEEGEYVINLLQCRPLKVLEEKESRVDFSRQEGVIFLECEQASMGLSRHQSIDLIVYVDPIAYYQMPYQEKYQISQCLGAINHAPSVKERMRILLSPGRIGTSSPELGVPTSFADISGFDMICEVAESRAGYCPELSYGSHFFQDLVESDILYTAVFEGAGTKVFRPELLEALPNQLEEIVPAYAAWKDIVRVADVSQLGCELLHGMHEERVRVSFTRWEKGAEG